MYWYPGIAILLKKRSTARSGGEKTLRPRQFPPLLINIITTALLACEGAPFTAGGPCPHCGGSLSGYDEYPRRFALLQEEGEPRPVQVIIRRSTCRDCGRIILPSEPFYPGTRAGSPVVDLCRSFAVTLPYSRVSSSLARMGLLVDRWSVRHYALAPLPAVPSIEVFGMTLPVSIISLSTLAGSLQTLSPLSMDDILMACNYPSSPPPLPGRVRGTTDTGS